MNQCLVCISLILFFSVSAQTLSQESNDGDTTDSQTTNSEVVSEPEVAESSNGQSSGKARSKEPVFRPSEEISEDSPVPFPVDI